MAFYQPQIAYVESWAIAAAAGAARLQSVSLPPIGTTQATIFTAWTSAVAPGGTATSGGDGSYYSSTGALLSGALGASSAMSTSILMGTDRYAACNLIGDAESVAVNTPLDAYLADGIRYDFQLGTAAAVGDPTISIPVNALLTIMVLDGTGEPIPATAKAPTGGSLNYEPIVGDSTFFSNYWLDANYSVQIHIVSSWNATATADHVTNEGENFFLVDEVSLPASGSVPSVYHDVEVAANAPASATRLSTGMWHVMSPTNGVWAVMQYQTNIVPDGVMLAVPAQLVTILG